MPRFKVKPVIIGGIRRFRKKSIIVEAVQYRPGDDCNCEEVAKFIGDPEIVLDCRGGFPCDMLFFPVETPEGTLYADPGDWIIKSVNGEFYPCKPDIFEKTYEPVPQDEEDDE